VGCALAIVVVHCVQFEPQWLTSLCVFQHPPPHAAKPLLQA
jgi:hypothetical protein